MPYCERGTWRRGRVSREVHQSLGGWSREWLCPAYGAVAQADWLASWRKISGGVRLHIGLISFKGSRVLRFGPFGKSSALRLFRAYAVAGASFLADPAKSTIRLAARVSHQGFVLPYWFRKASSFFDVGWNLHLLPSSRSLLCFRRNWHLHWGAVRNTEPANRSIVVGWALTSAIASATALKLGCRGARPMACAKRALLVAPSLAPPLISACHCSGWVMLKVAERYTRQAPRTWCKTGT